MGTITLRWIEGHLMVASDSNGHSVVIGRSPEPPHAWIGMKPAELLLVAVASCSTWDITEILAKQREPLQDLKVFCTGEQLADAPFSFLSIHLHYVAYGPVDSEKLAKAIRLSEEKYCSVLCTLRPGVQITSDFEVL